MTDIDHVGSSEEVSLGAAMRELRVEKGMTIEELAEAAGLSTGLISKIERDLGNPSINSLRAISKALGVPTAFFFARETGTSSELISCNNKRVYTYPRSHVSYTAIISPVSDDFKVFMIEAMPGARGGKEATCHQGFEQGMVIEGHLELTVGDRVFELGPFDTASFPSTVPHVWENKGSERCRSIWAITTSHPLGMFDLAAGLASADSDGAVTEAEAEAANAEYISKTERNRS
ncbi:MAG: helix-turn-helix domain-containing protein [Firmicutes bacterium]|nr:helix-turn-helix domain-containing protein [Bacillota bacterium]